MFQLEIKTVAAVLCALTCTGVLASAAAAAPANDSFAAAQVIGGSEDFDVRGSNVGASKEAGEPNHAGDPGGKSVWFRWVAPVTSQVIINTCNPPLDAPGALTLLAVYTGSAVSALSPVAADDNGPGPPTCVAYESRVQFDVTAGTPYLIAVDGETRGGLYLPSEGAFNLHVSLPLGSLNPGGGAQKKCTKKAKRAAAAKKKCKKKNKKKRRR